MAFCTCINCMDGRMQLPVIQYLQDRLGVPYVDMITEPGPIKILAEGTDDSTLATIRRRIAISVDKHGSQSVAIVGHEDCAGNPVPKAQQLEHLADAADRIATERPGLEIIKLWVSVDGNVEAIP